MVAVMPIVELGIFFLASIQLTEKKLSENNLKMKLDFDKCTQLEKGKNGLFQNDVFC